MPAVQPQSYLEEDEDPAARHLREQRLSGAGGVGVGATTGASTPQPEAPRGQALGNLYQQFGRAQGGNIGFAQKIAEGQARAGEEFKGYAGQQAGAFRGASEAGTQQFDPGFVSGALAAPEALTPEARARFQAALSGRYTGPTSFADAEGRNVAARAGEIQAQQNVSDPGALAASIQRAGGGRGAGKQTLNLALLQGGPQREVIEAGQGRLGGAIASEMARTRSEADALAAANLATSQATGASTQAALTGALQGQEAANLAARTDAQAATLATQESIRRALASGVADDALLAILKMSRKQWTALQKDIRRVKRGFAPPAGPKARPIDAVRGKPVRPAPSRFPKFDPARLFAPSDVGAITTEQALTPEAGARTEALARLGGSEVAPGVYGQAADRGLPREGQWDQPYAQRLASIISRFRGLKAAPIKDKGRPRPPVSAYGRG